MRIGEHQLVEIRLRRDHVVLDRMIVAPQPQRIDQGEATDTARIVGGKLGCNHPAERMADDGRRLEAQLIE